MITKISTSFVSWNSWPLSSFSIRRNMQCTIKPQITTTSEQRPPVYNDPYFWVPRVVMYTALTVFVCVSQQGYPKYQCCKESKCAVKNLQMPLQTNCQIKFKLCSVILCFNIRIVPLRIGDHPCSEIESLLDFFLLAPRGKNVKNWPEDRRSNFCHLFLS